MHNLAFPFPVVKQLQGFSCVIVNVGNGNCQTLLKPYMSDGVAWRPDSVADGRGGLLRTAAESQEC